ncbi:MAG: hypothetical protein B7Y39_01415 [Bdellovibrio sp. 28-41-41]|nr:MAG: hypothetical protein B7Y39_01415 [Bdellovibrio sp. 28-41-41]
MSQQSLSFSILSCRLDDGYSYSSPSVLCAEDPSVSLRNFELFTREIAQLKTETPDAYTQTVVYKDYQHESIFNHGLPEFDIIWNDITKFQETVTIVTRK